MFLQRGYSLRTIDICSVVESDKPFVACRNRSPIANRDNGARAIALVLYFIVAKLKKAYEMAVRVVIELRLAKEATERSNQYTYFINISYMYLSLLCCLLALLALLA